MTPQDNHHQERMRLAHFYSQCYDGELINLRASYGELTENAQDVLRAELMRRSLWVAEEDAECVDGESSSGHIETDRISVWESTSREEAESVCHLLSLSDIEAVTTPLRTVGSSRMVQVSVASKYAEKALNLLSTGIPESVVKELAAQLTQQQFVAPCCVHCGSSQVILEAVGTVNSWLCSKCKTRWQDNPAEEPGGDPADSLSNRDPTESIDGDDNGWDTEALLQKSRTLRGNYRSIIVVVVGSVVALLGGWSLPWTTLRWVGLCLWIPSEVLWAIARIQLGASFAARAEARTLITEGLYSRIQNPIYVFGGMTIAGIVLYLHRPWYLLGFFVLIPLQMVRIKREREVLTKAFGHSYLQYRDETWF